MSADAARRHSRPDATEASRRRRAVHRALAPFLHGEELVQALCLWEEGAANGPTFALHDFVARICARPGLQERRAAMHLALVRSMTLPLAQLGPDPWPLMQAARRGQPPAPAVPAGEPDASLVFEHLLGRIFQDLHDQLPGGVDRIRAWLQLGLRSRPGALGLDAGSAERVVLWLDGSVATIGAALPEVALRRLLHAVYVLVCEYCGPVVTDGLLADAVRSAEALPAARRFPPRQLL